MSNAPTPESAVPATAVPEGSVVVPETAVAAESSAVAAPVVVVAKKKRGLGAWAFVLGLLTSLVDVGLVVLLALSAASFASDLSSGDVEAVTAVIGGAGLVFVALLVFFGGILSAGVAALLGLIALIAGRGRVLGLFGLIFAAAAIIVRVLILSAGYSVDLG